MVHKNIIEDFKNFEKAVNRLEEIKKEVSLLDTTGFEEEKDSIISKIKNVSLLPSIERELRDLKYNIVQRDIKQSSEKKLKPKKHHKIKSKNISKLPSFSKTIEDAGFYNQAIKDAVDVNDKSNSVLDIHSIPDLKSEQTNELLLQKEKNKKGYEPLPLNNLSFLKSQTEMFLELHEVYRIQGNLDRIQICLERLSNELDFKKDYEALFELIKDTEKTKDLFDLINKNILNSVEIK